MESPTDLFDDSSSQIHTFAPSLNSTDFPGAQASVGRPAPAFRPPGFPHIHHLLQPGGGPRRIGRILTPNPSTQRLLDDRSLEEDDGVTVREIEQEMEREKRVMEGEDNLLEVKKRLFGPYRVRI